MQMAGEGIYSLVETVFGSVIDVENVCRDNNGTSTACQRLSVDDCDLHHPLDSDAILFAFPRRILMAYSIKQLPFRSIPRHDFHYHGGRGHSNILFMAL